MAVVQNFCYEPPAHTRTMAILLSHCYIPLLTPNVVFMSGKCLHTEAYMYTYIGQPSHHIQYSSNPTNAEINTDQDLYSIFLMFYPGPRCCKWPRE